MEAAAYDRAIRVFIPAYEEMIAAAVAVLRGLPSSALVVDLGAGTGALSEAILDSLDVRVRLLDVDPAMLAVAAERLTRFGGRAEVVRGRFDDPLPRCDAVVASLALHHVPDPDDKRRLYARIREALAPGGRLVIADVTVHEAGPEREHAFAEWTAHLVARGLTREQAHEHFGQWALEDRYFPLAAELEALARAGFPAPDCFWKHGPSTVFGAFTPPRPAGTGGRSSR